jgi:hypothetical protein
MPKNFQPSRVLSRGARIARTLGVLGALVTLGSLETAPGIGSGVAHASSLSAMSLQALSANADRIVVGTVEKSEAHFVSSNSRYIVTDVTVRSERNLLGVPEGSRFVVRHLGGVVGELGQRVFGEASYRVGEQVLLFAAERQGSFYALGMAQGALHVYRDSAGTARVETQLAGAELVSANGAPLAPAAAAATGRSLDEVIAEVRSYVAQRQPAPTAPQRKE